jgi:hypothetical protein
VTSVKNTAIDGPSSSSSSSSLAGSGTSWMSKKRVSDAGRVSSASCSHSDVALRRTSS